MQGNNKWGISGRHNCIFVGGGGVYGRVVDGGLSETTLGMIGIMVVKEVLMDSYGKISSWKTTSRLVKTWWVSRTYNL